MKLARHAFLAAPLALLLACGGSAPGSSSSSSNGSAQFANAAPSYDTLALDQTGPDASSASVALTTPAAAAATATTPSAPLPSAECHPHLFLRTREVVARVNFHLYKFLRHIERAMAKDATATTGSTQTWERVIDGLDMKFTVTKVSDPVFSWELDVAPAGTTNFAKVFFGQIDRTGAAGPHQGVGSLTLDLSALASVDSNEKVAGQITIAFDVTATSRKVEATATDVVWDVRDPLATDSKVLKALEQPRSGHYVYFREPGIGGSLKIQDQMVFACPSNPNDELADVKLVSRWYKLTDGTVHGRSDAILTGGQLADTANTGSADPIVDIQGVTCHQGADEDHVQAESFWLMKAEDAAGATVEGWSSEQLSGAAASACDPTLGAAVPELADNTNDFDFTTVDFTDSSVVPFPNEK